MKDLKVLNLSIPTLDSSECKALMGGDGYGYNYDDENLIDGGYLDEVIVTANVDSGILSDTDRDADIDNETYDDDNDLNNNVSSSEENSNQISQKDLSEILRGMNKGLADKITDLWKNGLLSTGNGKSNAPAYYDIDTGKIHVNTLLVSENTLAHEYTHYLQHNEGNLSPHANGDGDANNEMQAWLTGSLFSYENSGYFDADWLDEQKRDFMTKHIGTDEDGNPEIDKELWDKLNDEDYMKEILEEWLDYWSDRGKDGYTAGPNSNWDYDWEAIFAGIGIGHP